MVPRSRSVSGHRYKFQTAHACRRSFAISPRVSREFWPARSALFNQRAQGMPGARCARSRAWCVESTRVSHHGHTGNTRHSPRNGFNGFLRTLPGDRAFLPPSPPRSLLLKNLTPASGRQDHTTSPSATAPLVLRRRHVHRIPRPTSVTIAKRPSEGAGPNCYISVSTEPSSGNSENPKFLGAALNV